VLILFIGVSAMNARASRLAFVVMLAGTVILERSHAQSNLPPGPAKPVVCLGSSRYRHPSTIEHADLSPDGRTLYTLSEKGVYVWNRQTGVGRFLFSDARLRNALKTWGEDVGTFWILQEKEERGLLSVHSRYGLAARGSA
jgi:hypothetical protein